ncbi:Hypothetical protein CINCED_3A006557 [Cinara cedri]|uniref:Uncharacterized protein n=1 Tax=Cinara cedri TaxID=506608 RepID=A0A5E4N4S2_9HEMI|nr:Hypothetical protein CINCED_3A006557 [Cinara cedri]
MQVGCFRVFVDGKLWDCLLILKHNREYVLYTTIDQWPFRVSAELHALQQNDTCDPEPVFMDANCLECVIKTLENSDAFKRSVIKKMNVVTAVDNNNIIVGVRDVHLMTPIKYKLAYKWCELYQTTDIEFRELENIMAWLSTLGGAFSSLGDQTKHCVNTTILFQYILILNCLYIYIYIYICIHT